MSDPKKDIAAAVRRIVAAEAVPFPSQPAVDAAYQQLESALSRFEDGILRKAGVAFREYGE